MCDNIMETLQGTPVTAGKGLDRINHHLSVATTEISLILGSIIAAEGAACRIA
jgi:hypothetical protein